MRWKQQPIKRVWLFCDGSTGALYTPDGVAPSAAAEKLTGGALAAVCAAAAVAHGEDGGILDWAWQQLPVLTNNEAEYAGLLLGLALAQRLRVQEAICVLDSEIVIGQMEGRFAVKSTRLRHWHQQACNAARALPCVRYVQIPREWNRLADGLAAQAAFAWPALLAAVGKREWGREAERVTRGRDEK